MRVLRMNARERFIASTEQRAWGLHGPFYQERALQPRRPETAPQLVDRERALRRIV
jgi:hypothetical protein